jgi:hypothetical protein
MVRAMSAEAAGLIEETLASGERSGYRFTYAAGKRDKSGRVINYTVRADPIAPEETTHYFTDQSQVVRKEVGKQASAISSPILEPDQ